MNITYTYRDKSITISPISDIDNFDWIANNFIGKTIKDGKINAIYKISNVQAIKKLLGDSTPQEVRFNAVINTDKHIHVDIPFIVLNKLISCGIGSDVYGFEYEFIDNVEKN